MLLRPLGVMPRALKSLATQFHPELELRMFIQRLQIYADNGYYEPYEYDAIVAGAAAANLETDNLILRNFRDLYAR